MICPECQKPPMAWWRYALSVRMRRLICQHCSTRLTMDNFGSRYWWILILATFLTAGYVLLLNQGYIDIHPYYVFATLLILWGVADRFAYEDMKLTKEETAGTGTTAPKT